MRSRPLILTALLLLAATAWLAWHFGGDRASEGSVQPEVDAPRPAPDPGTLAAPAPELPIAEEGRDDRVAALDPDSAMPPTEPDASADAPDEEEGDAPLPPDPVERGECELFLEVFERTTREPVATTLHLWRLDAPGNEHWTAGDQRQAIVEVAAGGSWIRELPAGRYRARCVAERRGNDDPQEFVVRCPSSVQRLDVDLPRDREVLLRLYTASGEPIHEAEVCLARTGGSSHSIGTPSWVTSRELKEPRESWGYGMGGAWSGRGLRRWTTLRADADGWFHVGEVREGDRKSTPDYQLEARVDGLTRLSHRFDGDDDSLRFAAVLIDPAPVERSVLTPDGRTSDELEDGLTIRSGALPLPLDPAPDAWRDAPLEAWRRWEKDYEDLEFDFHLNDLPLPTRVLVPKDGSEN